MADGEVLWSVTVEGRVDSPPSCHKGLLYFGSADGRVHCVRAGNGGEVWEFLAAPLDRRIVSNDAVESVWPVHGSVLVHAGSVWVSAGRSSYLDGGIALYRLDPLTVDEQWEIETPIWAGAMAAAEDALVIAGPTLPDRRSKDAAEALAGKRGSKLMLISRTDGSVMAELDLPAPPAWDGLAVASGCAVISGSDGVLRCYASAR